MNSAGNKKCGIVDDKGQEIVAPTYLWAVYTLHDQSQFIALNSYEEGGLIINKKTGKIEKFESQTERPRYITFS